MKVLQVGINKETGGIETFLVNLVSKVDRNNLEIDFIKYSDAVAYEDKLCQLGSKFYKLTSRSNNPIRFYISLIVFFFKHKEYRVVHNHLNSASCIGATVIAKLFGRKTITHSHNEYIGGRFITRLFIFFNKPLLNRVTDIRLACSHKAGKSMFGNRPYQLISNGVDLETFCFRADLRSSARTEFDYNNSHIVLGHIGGFKYQKNHDFLIDVFFQIYLTNNNYRLLLVGDGVLKNTIVDKVNRLGISDVVTFTGQRSDTDSLYNAMDVFLLPSHFEGLPFVAVEAQAAGLPVILSDIISDEVNLTPNVQFIPLDSDMQSWLDGIVKFSKVNRCDINTSLLKNSGFDSMNTASRLREVYFSLTQEI